MLDAAGAFDKGAERSELDITTIILHRKIGRSTMGKYSLQQRNHDTHCSLSPEATVMTQSTSASLDDRPLHCI
jgi:hypothetical protein